MTESDGSASTEFAVEFLRLIDEAVEKAVKDGGLVRVPTPKNPPLPTDPRYDHLVNTYLELVDGIEMYINGKGYVTEKLFFTDKGYAFMILWKKGSAGDPAVATQSR